MNERFKFRFWNEEKKKYEELGNFPNSVNEFFVFIDNYVIEQSTGLKDKKGKLIYEGDIIASRFQGQLLAAKIKYYRAGFVAEFHYWKPSLYQICNEGKFEVIGNIHENPELLGG